MQKNSQALSSERVEKLISFRQDIESPLLKGLSAIVTRPIERTLAIDRINAIYRGLLEAQPAVNPFNIILRQLKITYLLSADDLAKVPGQGPLVVVANHPFGGLEGIILGNLLQRVRPDTKILGNYLLEKIEPIKDSVIPVDPFDRKTSVSANVGAFRASLKWLKAGNCLVIFPSGEVSHYRHRQRRITDPPWSEHVAALVRMSGATVLPVYFPGRNSILFNLLGMIHPRLRTIMLGRELVARQGQRVRLFIGGPISGKSMQSHASDHDLIRWLRFKTYFLANRSAKGGIPEKLIGRIPRRKTRRQFHEPIQPVAPTLLAAEIDALPEANCLLRHKHMAVLVADSEQIPHLMREIGRLREVTFREVGEGTGNAVDIDLFDSYYRHLILWNTEKSEVVGAYRMGDTRAILAQHGRKGLYTHSLFRLKTELLRYLGNSLELGRSFIRSEYQRQPNCLALLWKGIGAYLVGHPQYHILFGPVSISNHYHRVSRNIMVRFLQRSCTVKELSAHVRPRTPLRQWPSRDMHRIARHLSNGSIDDVSMMVAEIEDDGKRVPVLIKHYLKLNGQFIAFNLDRDFSDVVDGLVVVDLLKTETKLLDRFMGADGRRFYRERWEGGRLKLKGES